MRKYIFLLAAALFLAGTVTAQNPATLTNNLVIKMSKAGLSDELIVDMINDSPVQFDLSDQSVRSLSEAGVTSAVITAMKSTSSRKNGMPVITPPPAASQPAPPATIKQDDTAVKPTEKKEPVRTEVTTEALNYTIPLLDLIRFNENEYNSFVVALSEWEKQVQSSSDDVRKSLMQIRQVETELADLINSDTKAFSPEIKTLQKKLDAYRNKYQQSRAAMIKSADNLLKKLTAVGADRLKSIDKAYGGAAQKVSASDASASAGSRNATLTYTRSTWDVTTDFHLEYLVDILAWYQNEMGAIDRLLKEWNPRVEQALNDDEALKAQLLPLETRSQELKQNQKENKAELSTLKKQISDIEKKRKQVDDRVRNDIKELSANLKSLSQADQAAVRERFADVVENITYCFQEKPLL